MGITLDDVNQIIGITIMGRAVSIPPIESFNAAIELVSDTLHIQQGVIIKELNSSNGRSAWVYELVQDDHVIQRFPRAALWKMCSNSLGLQKSNVVAIRELIDSLTPEQSVRAVYVRLNALTIWSPPNNSKGTYPTRRKE
ncbi:hypothetical protein QJS10_CPB13g01103 [Acorus calamus]|uniref:Uncharacterized protein n=1 Tax=Acorus calamus TaxID=4465 RepID=A0AAV9DIY1_ACOCL|nr:hypothetical protein QJS10_CPB13g01103 [Acorus calamus]